MKKIIFAFTFLPLVALSQLIAGKNVIKANLSSLAFKNYHATFERQLSKRTSISLSYRYMQKQHMPYESLIKQFYDDPNLVLEHFLIGNTAITPEFRLYTGKMQGFYMAFYGRFATFDFTLPLKYNSTVTTTSTANFDGKIKSSSAGIMFGIQKKIAKKLVLDFWIIGANYGESKGDLIANNFGHTLSNYEKDQLQQSINNLDVQPFQIKGTVANDGKSATIQSAGPWAGIRGLGISLGIRF